MTSTGSAKQPFHQLNKPTKKRITTIRPAVVIGSIVGGVLVLIVGIWLSFGGKPKDKEAPPVPPSSATIATMASKTLADFPTEPAPSIPAAAADADAEPVPAAQAASATPGQGRNTGSPPAAPGPPARLPPPGSGGQPGQGTGRTQPQTTAEKAPSPDGKEKRKPWLSQKSSAAIDKPPFPVEDEKRDKESKAHGLFPQAVWATPKHPERVLYQDQLVHGVLLADFNSDTPGTMLVLVTQQVEDRWGQGAVLIPQYAVLVGKPQGALTYGKSTLQVPITSGIWPDGTAVELDGQIGTSRGAAGLTGKIDNHMDKVLVGTVLTALLNIGVRVPFGNTESYNPSLPQEFSRDFAQGLSQAGQAVIQRQLNVNPTLTQTHGYAVSVAFNRNISFMSQPIMVSK